jgi:alkyl sulfatase BDS1-like metallo-beta-lactamase superfamily hydrolase
VSAVSELAERAWAGELGKVNLHPGSVLVGLEEFETGLAFMSAFSNVAVLETEEGLVFLDTSSPFHARKLHECVRAWSAAPLHTAVYTHGHIDHVFGVAAFEAENDATVRVIAHQACPERFDRYRLTNGYNGIINMRQFGFPEPRFPKDFRYPDETMGNERVLEVGGERIELYHDRGETDDHIWAWLPARKTIYTGDLFIWAAPNCGNPQKVQRYPREWALALRKMERLDAERLFPGHGPPIIGAPRVQRALSESAELLEILVEQTLALMNEGARLNDILHAVKIPEHLLVRPYLRPIYDDPLFIVRNLWRLYGGWYDGDPAHLKPARDRDLAEAVADLCGGSRALADRAQELGQRGELAVACQLVEFAWRSDPADAGIVAIRSALYRQRAEAESSLMAKGIFGAAARDSEPGDA